MCRIHAQPNISPHFIYTQDGRAETNSMPIKHFEVLLVVTFRVTTKSTKTPNFFFFGGSGV
jgi:hypothetical protein